MIERSFYSTSSVQVSKVSCVVADDQCDSVTSGGNLFNLIQQKSNQGFKGLPEGEVLEIVSDIIKGLLHMHLQNPPIAHRDIKVRSVVPIISDHNKYTMKT